MDERSTTTGGDPAGGADPGGTRSTKGHGGAGSDGSDKAEQHVESGDRNATGKEAPIRKGNETGDETTDATAGPSSGG